MLSVYYKRLEQSTLGCSNLEHFTYVSSICIVLIGTDCYFNISSIVLRIWTLLWSFSIIYSRFFIEIVFPTPICLFLTDFLGLQIYLICSEVNVCNTKRSTITWRLVSDLKNIQKIDLSRKPAILKCFCSKMVHKCYQF